MDITLKNVKIPNMKISPAICEMSPQAGPSKHTSCLWSTSRNLPAIQNSSLLHTRPIVRQNKFRSYCHIFAGTTWEIKKLIIIWRSFNNPTIKINQQKKSNTTACQDFIFIFQITKTSEWKLKWIERYFKTILLIQQPIPDQLITMHFWFQTRNDSGYQIIRIEGTIPRALCDRQIRQHQGLKGFIFILFVPSPACNINCFNSC